MSIKTDLAYLAGVIDSDGCIRVERLNNHGRSKDSVSYAAIVTVQQVESEAVILAKKLLDGCILKIHDKRPNASPMLRWTVKSKKAATALNALKPYLRIKIEQADNALHLSRIIAKSKSTRCIGRAFSGAAFRSTEDTSAMEICYQLSRSLNKTPLQKKRTRQQAMVL